MFTSFFQPSLATLDLSKAGVKLDGNEEKQQSIKSLYCKSQIYIAKLKSGVDDGAFLTDAVRSFRLLVFVCLKCMWLEVLMFCINKTVSKAGEAFSGGSYIKKRCMSTSYFTRSFVYKQGFLALT